MGTEGPERQLTTLADGRALEFVTAGEPDGPVVVFHHGTPGSSFAPRGLLEAASSRGRASSQRRARATGGRRATRAAASRRSRATPPSSSTRSASTASPRSAGRAVARTPSRARRCCRTRCVAALSVAGVAPYLPGEFDWTEGMGPENVEEFELGLEAGPAYDEMLASFRDHLLSLSSAGVRSARELFGELVSDADEAASTPESVAFLLGNTAHGLATGVGGWRDDDQSFLHDWGFDVRAITPPVGVWFGDDDLMVPPRHGEWLGAHVAGAEVVRFADGGHISIVEGRHGALLDALLALAGTRW